MVGFALYELALNPLIQERLRSEIKATLNTQNKDITYEAISKLAYLDMVLNESLRKWPVSEIQMRSCTEDFHIPKSKLVIKKGTIIFIPIAGLHYDERFWKSPEVFDPERFREEEVKARHGFTHIPFSDGPRKCIGELLS